jgi:hypothetical protein
VIMKKYILLSITLFIFFVSFKTASAQDLDYNRAYQDYVYNFDLYKKAHAEYEVAKTQYSQGKTLALQQKAQEATAKMLQARDQVVINYLTAIRLKMAEIEGIDETKREGYYSLIDAETAWYRSHRDAISSAASLEDLQADSNEARSRYLGTELTIYNYLNLVENGKIFNLKNRPNDTISRIEGKVGEIRSAGDKDTTDIERWILEVKNRVTRSTDKETESWVILDTLKPAQKEKADSFNGSVAKLAESLQYLKEANSFLKQIVTEIKTAD